MSNSPNQRLRLLSALPVCILSASLLLAGRPACADDEPTRNIASALQESGDNRPQLQSALDNVPQRLQEAMEFLIVNMPKTDLQSLSADFLLEHVEYAHKAWQESKWKDQVPKEIFLNNILPYSSIDERRDAWRKDFFERFRPLIADAKTPSEAAALLNQKIFPLVDVKYSRRRPKANQSPYESIAAHVASCSGLSVLLIDACRAVGVPARFVGTPLWSDRSGNHSWVEAWDNGWHFTGAAEPSGNELDKAWFVGRASKAQLDDLRHAIYATSFKRTPLTFPMVWNRRSKDVFAVNVTNRYTRLSRKLPPGSVEVLFCVWDSSGRNRVPAEIRVTNTSGKLVFSGTTNDERFDGNDHLSAVLPVDASYQVAISYDGTMLSKEIHVKQDGQLERFLLGK